MYNHQKLAEIYSIAVQNNTLPQFIKDGEDYHKKIVESKSLLEAFKYNDKIGPRDIIEIYLSENKATKEETDQILEFYKEEELYTVVNANPVLDKLSKFRIKSKYYEELMDTLYSYPTIPYDKKETVNRKHYIMKNKNGDKFNISDLVDIFNKLEPTKNIQIIIMTTNEGKQIFKVDTKKSIKNLENIFTYEIIPNSITFYYQLTKSVYDGKLKKSVFYFENSTCEIDINSNKINDDILFFVSKIIKNYIDIEEKADVQTIEGEMHIKGVKSLSYYGFYEFIMTDSLFSKLFLIDERINPWCATKKLYKLQFFSPLCYVLDDFLQGMYSIAELTISSTQTKSSNTSFYSKDEKLVEIMTDYFSKCVGVFTSKKTEIVNVEYENFFFRTTSAEIKYRAGDLIRTEIKSSSQSYTSSCNARRQPIFISDEEIEDYLEYGKEIGHISAGDKNYNYVCMSELFPLPRTQVAKIELISGNTVFPCCFNSAGDTKEKTKTKSNKVSETLVTKDYKAESESPSSVITNFLKDSFLKIDRNIEVRLMGTAINTGQLQNFNNSAICALILCGLNNHYNVTSLRTLEYICLDVRRRMIELPYEIFAQELYDVPRETFINNMLDPNHYIDPYLYYRGLEELFSVNIIVFTSTISKRQFPSSYEEANEENPTIEIPRAYGYHTRSFREDRNIVLLYKNFGSQRRALTIPSCELLIVCTQNGNKILSFNNSNIDLYAKIYEKFDECCRSFYIETEKSEGVNIYSTIEDWFPEDFGLGKPIGQELDENGKCSLLIFQDWNIRITPSIQPLAINIISIVNNTTIDEEGRIAKYKLQERNYERAPLRSVEECLSVFGQNTHEVVEDGVLISFKGIKSGLKVLCRNHTYGKNNYEKIKELKNNKNNISALLQLINWLWRSDKVNNQIPIFEPWFLDKVEIRENIQVLRPSVYLNNLYLPKFNNYTERINFCENTWRTFFQRGKIILTEGLKNRILNLMNFQDKYTGFLREDEDYGQVPMFITGLEPQDEDFETYDNMIFTKKEHLKMWYNYTCRDKISHISLNNLNVINSKIYEEMSQRINPFFFITDYGKIFLVQNIKSNIEPRNTAFQVANHWNKYRENLGPFGSSDFGRLEDLRYVVFKMTEENIPKPLTDKSYGQEDYLCILNYKSGVYASLLPIN